MKQFEGFIKVIGSDIARDSIACIEVIEDFNRKMIAARTIEYEAKRQAKDDKRNAHEEALGKYIKGQNLIDLKEVVGRYTKDKIRRSGFLWWATEDTVQETDWVALAKDAQGATYALIEYFPAYWRHMDVKWDQLKDRDLEKIVADTTQRHHHYQTYYCHDSWYSESEYLMIHYGLLDVQGLHQFTKLTGSEEFYMPISDYNLLLGALERKAQIEADTIKRDDSIINCNQSS
ncbi:hypothetical protein D3C73_114720 [compost metagenome]